MSEDGKKSPDPEYIGISGCRELDQIIISEFLSKLQKTDPDWEQKAHVSKFGHHRSKGRTMADLNPNIILAGQTPNFANALMQGSQAAQQTNQVRDQNALRQLYATKGAGIANGDQNALNALAGLNPGAALDVQNTRLGIDQTRETMARLSREEQRAVEEHAASLSAAERAAQAAKIENGVKMGLMIQTPEQWDAMAQQEGAPELVGQFANRQALAAKYMSMADILKRQEGPQPLSPQGKLYADQQAGLVPDGTFGSSDDASAPEAKIQRLMEDPAIDRATAIGIVDGRLTVSRDPVTGNAQIIDKASGRVVGKASPGVVEQSTAGTSMPEGTDFATATGIPGFVAQIANTVSDALGNGLVDTNNERATQAMNNLATNTMIGLADGVAGRPSNFLLEQFQRLTTEPNSVWQGEGRTREKLNQTRDMLNEAINLNEDVSNSEVTPTMRAQAQQNISRLKRLRNDYDAVIESFGSREKEGNKTSTGVTWSFKE